MWANRLGLHGLEPIDQAGEPLLVGDPGSALEFDTINVELSVIKEGLH
jgi:hypothetical protein